MSGAFAEVFGALVAGGMDAARAAFLLSQIVAIKAEPTAGALRMRKCRERKASQSVTVTPEVEKTQSNQTKSSSHVTSPLIEPPFKKDKKEEDFKSSPPAVLRFPPASSETIPAGFVSEDGTINFTADDIKLLEAQCPLVENVRGVIVNLAETDWIARKVAPYDRTRAIRAKIKKNQRLEAEKQAKAETPKQIAAVAAVNQAALEDEYADRQRRLAARRRHG